jgi:hypothetical protein
LELTGVLRPLNETVASIENWLTSKSNQTAERVLQMINDIEPGGFKWKLVKLQNGSSSIEMDTMRVGLSVLLYNAQS